MGGRTPHPKHAIAICCRHLVNTNDELGGLATAIPPFAKLVRTWLLLLQIAAAVENAVRKGSQCLVLGGDHSMAIGSVAGQARVHSDIGIIWVDAHADINPPTKSPTGNAHGMPIAFLARELRNMIPIDLQPGFAWLRPW